MKPSDNLADWIKENREINSMTQIELSAKLDISVVQISKMENGKTSTSIPTLVKMCEIFDCVFVVGRSTIS